MVVHGGTRLWAVRGCAELSLAVGYCVKDAVSLRSLLDMGAFCLEHREQVVMDAEMLGSRASRLQRARMKMQAKFAESEDVVVIRTYGRPDASMDDLAPRVLSRLGQPYVFAVCALDEQFASYLPRYAASPLSWTFVGEGADAATKDSVDAAASMDARSCVVVDDNVQALQWNRNGTWANVTPIQFREVLSLGNALMERYQLYAFGVAGHHNISYLPDRPTWCLDYRVCCDANLYGPFVCYRLPFPSGLHAQFGSVREDIERTVRIMMQSRGFVKFHHLCLQKRPMGGGQDALCGKKRKQEALQQEQATLQWAVKESHRNIVQAMKFQQVIQIWEHQDFVKESLQWFRKREHTGSLLPRSFANDGRMVYPRGSRYGTYCVNDDKLDGYITSGLGSYADFLNLLDSGDDDVVLDLGAHKGILTTEIALRGVRKVLAYEPEPDNFRCLQHHTQLNGVDGIVVAMRAAVVPGSPKHAVLFVGRASYSHTLRPTRDREEIRVPAAPASQVFVAEVTAIKMDIEGSEYDVCEYLRRCPKCRLLFIELHLTTTEYRAAAPKLVKMVESLGFRALRKPDLTNHRLWHTTGIWQRRKNR